jgi:hypothetical protein
MNTELRKNKAIDEAINAGINIMSMAARIKKIKQLEEKHSVRMHVENHCISVWTARTPITKRFI